MLTFHHHQQLPPGRSPTGSANGRFALGLSILLFGACSGPALRSERAARSDLATVGEMLDPIEAPDPSTLSDTSSLADFLRFAMLRSPRVFAAYADWAAAVERITPARSLPDPRLTFSADISDTVMSLMPGLMLELSGPGRLRAAGDVMAAESRMGYFVFEREVLRTALEVKSAYYRLHFLEESIRVEEETLGLVADLEVLARQQNAAGRVTLQDVLRSQIARDQLETDLANLRDSRSALAAEWKSALGLGPDAAAPPLPARFEPSADPPSPEELLGTALARNPELRAMREDIQRAEAALTLAQKARVPDFSAGLEVDLKADPLMFRPSAGVTLPVWRDKVAAGIAAAQASKRAAASRLDAEEVRLAAELASMFFLFCEAARSDALLRERLLPKARQSLDAARAGYVNGRAGFLDVIDAQRSLLEFELEGIQARTRRELALASLSLALAGVAPADAPLLDTGPGSGADDRGDPTRTQENRP